MYKRLFALGLGLAVAHCGGPRELHGIDSNGDADTKSETCTTSATQQFVVASIHAPTSPTDAAVDLDGDGHPDNKLGAVNQAMAGYGLSTQSSIDKSISHGTALPLLEIQSSDSKFQNDTCATLTLSVAESTTSSPNFSATSHYTVNSRVTSVTLTGKITNGKFVSDPQTGTSTPFTMTVPLLGILVGVPLTDLHVTGIISADHKSFTNVELAGALMASDFSARVLPVVTTGINELAAVPITGAFILGTFDNGGVASGACAHGCPKDGGGCAASGDGYIDSCEIIDSSVVFESFQPDVAIMSGGKISPSATRTPKDAYSFGVTEQATQATF